MTAKEIAAGPDLIHARIYDQEGSLQPFPMRNTKFNRDFAEWLAIHDRSNAILEQKNRDAE